MWIPNVRHRTQYLETHSHDLVVVLLCCCVFAAFCLSEHVYSFSVSVHLDTVRSVCSHRKNVRGRCHNQGLLCSDQCAPHHFWRTAPSIIGGAQRRGLAPPRNRHDAAERVVQAAFDGSRDTRHHIPKPGARLSRCSWLRPPNLR